MSARLTGTALGRIRAKPPGPKSRALTRRLRKVENRDVTYVGGSFPIFLNGGAGANLVDVDGNVYVDLTAAFAVAAVGHSNPRVVRAVGRQAARLMHGMGDTHPTPEKVELASLLCALTPGRNEKRVIFASSGSEAIEGALKTVAIATGKPGVLAFTGAYHGLTYGSLSVTDREHFRAPFRDQLNPYVRRAAYAYCYRCPIDLVYPQCSVQCLSLVEQQLDGPGGDEIGAVIVEPMQGRGGDVIAPFDWLQGLRRLCDRRGLLLVLDEVYTGFGRTGRWFACEHAGVVPDLIVVGKGMSSGFPISATIGRADIMDRWPASTGESIHTSTFLGHPTGCAAALASIGEIRKRNLVQRAARVGRHLGKRLRGLQAEFPDRIGDVRGCGFMWGLECVDRGRAPDRASAQRIVARLIQRGVIVLTAGPTGNVIQLAPPLVITERQLDFAMNVLRDSIAA